MDRPTPAARILASLGKGTWLDRLLTPAEQSAAAALYGPTTPQADYIDWYEGVVARLLENKASVADDEPAAAAPDPPAPPPTPEP